MGKPFPLGPDTPRKFSIAAQVEEVERELGKRDSVYPGLVFTRKLTQAQAEFHYARMVAVGDTLRWVRDHAGELRRGRIIVDVLAALAALPASAETSALCGRLANMMPKEPTP